jgi:peptide chain release factor
MPRFGVTPQKEAELLRRMEACAIQEVDLQESFIRGSGSGGQKVNKTASCVQLLHRPTGLEVKIQEARSQALNRFFARRRLCELMEEKTLGKKSPEALRQEKIRKQKKRRKRRVKQSET